MRVMRETLRQHGNARHRIFVDSHSQALQTVVYDFLDFLYRHARHPNLHQSSLNGLMFTYQIVDGIRNAYQDNGCADGVVAQIFYHIRESDLHTLRQSVKFVEDENRQSTLGKIREEMANGIRRD